MNINKCDLQSLITIYYQIDDIQYAIPVYLIAFLAYYFNNNSDILQLFSSSILDDLNVVINIQQTKFGIISSSRAHFSTNFYHCL